MTSIIYKWVLPDDEEIEIVLPKRTKILSFQNQDEELTIWGLVDIRVIDRTEKRYFRVITTGEEIHDSLSNLKFIGTAKFRNGSYILHLFERLNRRR